jgi:hypothetical protein
MVYRTFWAILLAAFGGGSAWAQSAPPIVSGGMGFFSSTDGVSTFFQPVIAPVAVVPLGNRWLLEARADLREVIRQNPGTGDYEGRFSGTLEYLQIDYNVSSKLTLTAGRFLTPFGIYNERLTPIWIRNLQDAPLIFPIGTRTTGSSVGGMARGALISRAAYELNYAAYFSSSSGVTQFQSGRAAGGRVGIFLPATRLEFGVSYQRFLQDEHMNSVGAHFSWQPYSVPLDVRAEYAHSLRGQGYWIEAAYRFSGSRGPDSWLGRLQCVARVQQFYRLEQGPGDLLPSVDTQRADFGLNYFLPHEVRLNASYGRRFSDQGNRNLWNVGLTYRFLWPLWPGRTK